jgi:DNA-binding response OmpR family regulator
VTELGPPGGPPLLAFPDPLPADLAEVLERAGLRWRAVGGPGDARSAAPDDGWGGAVVSAATDPNQAFAVCRAVRGGDDPLRPLLVVVRPDQLADLSLREDLFDDFCLTTATGPEVATRLDHLLARSGRDHRQAVIAHGPLVLNLETYQAQVAGRPLDLTYMEYELLRFLAARPGKVFTRETLLSRVWGYEYYGGARTVDVHIRRLRAKLGEEHAHLIETVRSVGYRFSASAGR